MKPSFMFDSLQVSKEKAKERLESLNSVPLEYSLPSNFDSSGKSIGFSVKSPKTTKLKAVIVREKGTNGDRELAVSLYGSGFQVRDVTMEEVVSGKVDFKDISSPILNSAIEKTTGFQRKTLLPPFQKR